MHRSLSWIEPERLAESLVRAGVPATGAARRHGAAGPAAGPLAVTASRTLLPPRAAEPPPSSLGASGARLEERLEDFVRWISRVTRARTVFVLDSDGLALSRSEAPDELLSVAPFLLSSVERARRLLDFPLPEAVTLAVSLDGDRVLRLIRVPSPVGRVSVGIVTERPAEPVPSSAVEQALATLFREEA